MDFISSPRNGNTEILPNVVGSNASENKSPNSEVENEIETIDCDYDKNPSELYSLIQKKRWEEAIERVNSNPLECHTWVYRKEDDGKLRWRLLPLHASIIFRAPDKVVEALLVSYPEASQWKDDQGMLPIHLALRNGSSDVIVYLLLLASPECIEVTDRKNRLPKFLAQNSKSNLKDAYINALDRSTSFYAVATASYSRKVTPVSVSTIQKSDSQLLAIKRQAETEKINSSVRIEALEKQLSKTKESSNFLVDHVKSLEAQLNTRTDTERFLATKIANLDTALKELGRSKELSEAHLNTVNDELSVRNEELEAKCSKLEDNLNSHMKKSIAQEQTLAEKTDFRAKNMKMIEEKCKILEMERTQALSNNAIMENQLKSKIQTEHVLASQVSDLASKLADSAASTSSANSHYVKRIDSLQMEKSELKRSLASLTKKLREAIRALDKMSKEQEAVMNFAAKHKETMTDATLQQQQIMADTARQEQILIDAAREREQIVSILTRQAEEIEKTRIERERLVEAVALQEENMVAVNKERENLLDAMDKQMSAVDALKETINENFELDELQEIIEETIEETDEGVENKTTVPLEITEEAQISPSLDESELGIEAAGSVEQDSDAIARDTKEEEEKETSVEMLLKQAEDLVASIPYIKEEEKK